MINNKKTSKYIGKNFDEYVKMSPDEKLIFLSNLKGNISSSIFKKGLALETFKSIEAMKSIQKSNGEKGSNRYIISNCQSTQNILELFALIRLNNWDRPTIDIIPLLKKLMIWKLAVR